MYFSNNMSDKQFHIHTHKAVSLRIDCFFLTKIIDWSDEMIYAYSAKTEHSLRMSGALFRQERIIALLVNKVTCFLHVYRDLESLIDML